MKKQSNVLTKLMYMHNILKTTLIIVFFKQCKLQYIDTSWKEYFSGNCNKKDKYTEKIYIIQNLHIMPH